MHWAKFSFGKRQDEVMAFTSFVSQSILDNYSSEGVRGPVAERRGKNRNHSLTPTQKAAPTP